MQVVEKIVAIHCKIKAEGVLQPKLASSVDVWELNGVKSLMTDAGYGLQISNENVSVWVDLGCKLTGFMRGDEQELDSIMQTLGIAIS